MNPCERSLLAISLTPEVFVRIPPLLGHESFQVSTPSDPRLAILAIAVSRFHLIITAYPLEGVPFREFLDEVRGIGRPCLNAGLIAVAAPEWVADAVTHIGSGLNRVVSTSDTDDVLGAAIRGLLTVPPRVQVQATVSVTPETATKGGALMAQTVNLSRNGMLVRMSGELEVERLVTFRLTLPGARRAIVGLGEIVRATNPRRESVTGVGIRFIRLDDEGSEQLGGFIEQRLSEEKAGDGPAENG